MRTLRNTAQAVRPDEAADFTAELLNDLAEIAETAGLTRSAIAIGLAADFIRMEAGRPPANRQTDRT